MAGSYNNTLQLNQFMKHAITILLLFIMSAYPGSSQDSLVQDRTEIPVICFHHISKSSDRQNMLFTSVKSLEADLRLLYASGYQTISPEQLYDYYINGKSIPEKSIMITFDDGNLDQFSMAIPILQNFNFKAVFFIMTVTVGKKNYLSEDQIRSLIEMGHSIGGHTWDHQDVKSLKSKDLHWQVERPKAYLEGLTGRPVIAFAYPYGSWNEKIIPGLKKYGFKLAFQLGDIPSNRYRLFSLRRLMISGNWSPELVIKRINSTFGNNTMKPLVK
ncbi:MAG: polysaccharide deacetylase family protein [Chitinophagaceae bacterium]|nr:MAG: polysaccharide deacetylase family protein [Chitinophagaceae bacterium]